MLRTVCGNVVLPAVPPYLLCLADYEVSKQQQPEPHRSWSELGKLLTKGCSRERVGDPSLIQPSHTGAVRYMVGVS